MRMEVTGHVFAAVTCPGSTVGTVPGQSVSEFLAHGDAIGPRRRVAGCGRARCLVHAQRVDLVREILAPQPHAETIIRRGPQDRTVEQTIAGLIQLVVRWTSANDSFSVR